MVQGGVVLPLSDRDAGRYAWIGWIVLFLVTAAIIASGSARTVVPAYREGAVYWMSGTTIYAHPGVGGFVYLPQAAVLFIPFALLPPVVGEVLWRLVNIGVFAFGVFQFSRLARGCARSDLFPLMTLVTLPLAWDCARNGQATLVIAGLMLFAVTDIARTRWWRATAWLCLGVAVKPLVIVLALLVMAIDRPLFWRLPAGLLATALIPFATQHPAYVLEQYAAFWSSLTKAVHVGAVDTGWTTPFHALQFLGVQVSERSQTVIRVAAAAGTLALAAVARRRREASASALFLYALAAAYLMLFSPRTENNTYAMLGPALGAFLAQAFLVERRLLTGGWLAAMTAVLLAGRPLQRALTPEAGTSWVHPLIAAGFFLFLVWQLLVVPPAGDGGSGSGGERAVA